MPLGTSFNTLAQNNEQPEYQVLWDPLAVDPASAAVITTPTAAGAVGWVPGCVMQYNTAGVGAYPGPGGDSGGSLNPTFPNNWTVQYVDPMTGATSTNLPFIAGVLLGVGTLGAAAPYVPNTISGGPSLIAMVAKRGICQVYTDNTTTIGHTLNISTTSGHVGQVSDTGGTTRTIGTTIGIALQAVTVSAGPLLVWASVNIT